MESMEIRIKSIEDLGEAARVFARGMGDRRHFAFRGGMGAGKTTFIAALCRTLGCEDEATSPTFSIVNEYRADPPADDSGNMPSAPGGRVYHFDFYRIESREETLDLGLDDYFDSGCICLMEWPENVEDFLPDDTVDVRIDVADDGERTLSYRSEVRDQRSEVKSHK